MQPRFKLSPAAGTRLCVEREHVMLRADSRETHRLLRDQPSLDVHRLVPRRTGPRPVLRRVGRLAVHHVPRSGAANGPYQVGRSVIAPTHGAEPTLPGQAFRRPYRAKAAAAGAASHVTRGLDGTMRRQSGEPDRCASGELTHENDPAGVPDHGRAGQALAVIGDSADKHVSGELEQCCLASTWST